MLTESLGVSTAMAVVCVLIHRAGTSLLLAPVRSERGRRMREGGPFDVRREPVAPRE